MYLTMNMKCPLTAYFVIPYKKEPLTSKKIIKAYPKFAALFDGKCIENTLSFYYKKNNETGVYGFIDLDAEEEVAKLLGVKRGDDFLHHMSNIKTGIDLLTNCMKDMKTDIDWLNRSSTLSCVSYISSDSSDSEEIRE